MRRVTTSIAMTLAWAAVTAQPVDEPEIPEYPRYTVEVIIFEYAEEVSVGTELFLPELPPEPLAGEPGAEELVFSDATGVTPRDEAARMLPGDLAGEPEAEQEFVLLLEEEYALDDIARRLERLDVYRPVMHFAWTQETLPEEDTRAIELHALTEPAEGYTGSFLLYLGRYLHLVVDLSLHASGPAVPVAIDDSVSAYRDERGGAALDPYGDPAPSPVRYHIFEDRIFKSGDLRYFDHPKFGVLAKITRVEDADEPGAETGLVDGLGQ